MSLENIFTVVHNELLFFFFRSSWNFYLQPVYDRM